MVSAELPMWLSLTELQVSTEVVSYYKLIYFKHHVYSSKAKIVSCHCCNEHFD